MKSNKPETIADLKDGYLVNEDENPDEFDHLEKCIVINGE